MGRKRIHPPISIHYTLSEQLKVNWDKEYNNEFNCPHCNKIQLTNYRYDSKGCKLKFQCTSCKEYTYLTHPLPFYPISIHPTLHGELQVDWKQEYNNEFSCPYCETGKLVNFSSYKSTICKLGAKCDSCKKNISLTCTRYARDYTRSVAKHPLISTHQTLGETLKINWEKDYSNEFICPQCNQGRLINFRHPSKSFHQLVFHCKLCNRQTSLSYKIQSQISSYLPDIDCPNPVCNQIGPNGQKGWVYRRDNICYICYYCGINFNPESQYHTSWIKLQNKNEIIPFRFDDDKWDLRNFYDNPRQKIVNLQTIKPEWYQLQVKKYLYYLLKSNIYSSSSGSIEIVITTLRQFSSVLKKLKIFEISDIERQTILIFLDTQKNKSSKTINDRLSKLRDFLDWLEVETKPLIKNRDFLKISKNDVDWLDEIIRKAIKQHLHKIPEPLAHHYLVQEFTAARPEDICKISFDCLVEEEGKWYVKFYQHKTSRWHKILASREIRKIIEKQQKWIRQTFDANYPYLFCHFWNIKQKYYPIFSSLRPLPTPPEIKANANPMVKVIRIIIEKENVLDANGQKPHFIGKITRSSRLQEVRTKYGIEAAQLYADHKNSRTTFEHYTPPTKEQVAEVDLPFQELLMNPDNKFLPWQSLPESLLKNPTAHELDLEIAPRLVVYGHCILNPKTPCPVNLFPKCYGCSSFRPSTGKLPLYERQYQGEKQRLTEAEKVGAELAQEEAKATMTAMDKWLPELRKLTNG